MTHKICRKVAPVSFHVSLNSKGNVIGEIGGYTFLRETDRHFAFIDSILENY